MLQRETIMLAVETALSGLSATVLRNADVPEQVPTNGLVVVRDAAPEIEEETLGLIRSWYMRLDVPLELYIAGADADNRALVFDNLATQVYTALITNAGLMTLINHIEPTMLEIETLTNEGSQSFQAATLGVSIEYDATTSIG